MAMSPKGHANIGKYLKAQREKVGLSQRAVADTLGYSTAQFVSNWERGIISPPLKTMAVLIRLYKIPKKEFVDLLVNEYRSSILEALNKN